MKPVPAAFFDGLRVAALRRPHGNPAAVGAGAFVAAIVVYLLIAAFSAGIDAAPPRMFFGYGIVTVLADALLTLAAAWLLVRLARRDGIVWGVATIALTATATISLLIHWPLQYASAWLFLNGHVGLAAAMIWLSQAWWLFVLIVLARWLNPRVLLRSLLAAVLAYAISAVPWWGLPGAPIIVHDAQTAQTAAITQDANGEGGDDIAQTGFDDGSEEIDFDAEYVLYDQPRLLGEAFKALTPRKPGKPNLYVIAFAGDGGENVFRNEAEYVERLFGERFDAEGHIIVLENNPATVSTRPLATLTNLRWTLTRIAGEMNPAEDILLVYLTSHGSENHQLYVALDPLPLNQIAPDDLADALRTTPSMRWKVLIVNACYSGGFIDALRDDSTLVITAARPDRTSFGCGSESEITYFGKAFLAEALNRTTSIPEAFALAKKSVAEWELREKLEEPSEPQIATSRSIEARLERWRQTLPLSPAVPFAPAASAPDPTAGREP
jgi:hypothetical protein